MALPEEIRNSFTVFRTSDVCADLWKETPKGYAGREKPFEHGLIYPYYRGLMHMPELKPYALFALFLLVFPTGNAISERGFSAMGSIHTKQRSKMSHAQVLAHLILGFNGPCLLPCLNSPHYWMLKAGSPIGTFTFHLATSIS